MLGQQHYRHQLTPGPAVVQLDDGRRSGVGVAGVVHQVGDQPVLRGPDDQHLPEEAELPPERVVGGHVGDLEGALRSGGVDPSLEGGEHGRVDLGPEGRVRLDDQVVPLAEGLRRLTGGERPGDVDQRHDRGQTRNIAICHLTGFFQERFVLTSSQHKRSRNRVTDAG